MKNIIQLRAHHLICLPRFYSGGYNKVYAENLKKTCLDIRKNPDTKIKVIIAEPDVICKKCPYLSNKKCVNKALPKNWGIAEDKRIAKYLKIKNNSIHKARDVFNLSMEKVDSKTIKKVCPTCPYLDHCIKKGINNSFRKDLNRK